MSSMAHASAGMCTATGFFGSDLRSKGAPMLYWAAVFFIIALIAAIFGFGGIAASAAGIAKLLFFVFLILALLSFIFGRRVPSP
jgi:uncharacterized membrane protein YtjA (UPF0391 family)